MEIFGAILLGLFAMGLISGLLVYTVKIEEKLDNDD